MSIASIASIPLIAPLLTALLVLAGCVGEAFSGSGAGGTGGGAGGTGGTGGDAGVGGQGAGEPIPVKWPDSETARCTNGTLFLDVGVCPGQAEPFFGQDGFYRIVVPTYTDNDGTISDAVTGLIWEKAEPDAPPYVHGAAQEHCDALKVMQFKGHGDWRLPTRRELVSITDFGHSKAFPDVFDTADGFYWTHTDLAIDTGRSWVVKTEDGSLAYAEKTGMTLGRALCVSGGAGLDAPEYAAGDEVVTDLTTGLIWQALSKPAQVNWRDALVQCEDLDLGGKTDWRLPSVKELLSLVDDRASGPAVDKRLFPGVPSDGFWSSTPAISRTQDGGDRAISVNFANGASQSETNRNMHYARCVRTD